MTRPARQLDAATIRAECSDSSYQRGLSYFYAKRVIDFHIDQDQRDSVAISARVKGSSGVPYRQAITIQWPQGARQASIEGHCSCPVGYNCKHVAAACLDYQKRLQTMSASVNTTACFDWLESMDETRDAEFNPGNEFLAYILKPVAHKKDIAVEILITKFKKSGGLNKGRTTYLSHLNNTVTYSFNTPQYIQPQDEEIIQLLYHLPKTYSSVPVIKGRGGALVLETLLDSGRVYWQNLEQPALKSGEIRDLDCQWLQDDHGDYQLRVQARPAGRTIHSDPPYYIDEEHGLLGLINCPHLSCEQLSKLGDAPLVPAQYAEQFSQRLILEYPHLNLPTPKKVEIEEIENLTATPCLKLQGGGDRHGDFTYQLNLGFEYGSYRLSAGHSEDCSSLLTGQGYVRIHRDMQYEQQCIATILDAGFDIVAASAANELLFYSPGNNSLGSAQRWHDFIHVDLPGLREMGWRIEIDPSFRLDFQTAGEWEAEIEEGRNDWFEMRFNIDINGQSMALLPLLMPVLEHYEPDTLPETLTLPLGDHRFLTLPSDKLRPFLDILYEVFGNFSLNEQGGLNLSRFEAGSLAELENHSYGLFSLKGGEALRELGRKIQNFKGIADVTLPENFQAELRKYQQQGLNWLQFLREYQFGGILADDMGLGKTVQTLAHLLLEKQSGRMAGPCLIIAPTSLMSNWRREAGRFTPDLKVLVLQGMDRKLAFDRIQDYDLVLTTYPLLPRDEEILLAQQYYYLILDEAQIVKNPKAKAARIVRAIDTQHRLCLTGTPMENHLGELWTQFDFLMPGFLGDSSDFKRFYRTPIETHGDAEQRQRLSKRIAPFMLRRSKQDVVTELPPKTEIVRAVALGQKQAMLYESIRLTMEHKVQQAIAEKGLARSHITILDALLKLRQTCCDPRTLPLAEAKKVKESAKLELLMEMLPEMLAESRRILVFSQFTRMIALIEKELDARGILYSKLTGQTRQRDEAIERFKSGAANVFLISLKAGGVGLNLTEADTVIVYDPWWNPAAESQAADRAHRIGQDKPVFVYKLITENTVEEKILLMQERKRALAQGLYNGDKKEESLSLTAEDLTALFQPL
ncbi:MAG: DEAD/DEAH box helicase [Methylococcales bacterium]|nr:DEAD/DEAH box helicase [Methylococcales bacterium]